MQHPSFSWLEYSRFGYFILLEGEGCSGSFPDQSIHTEILSLEMDKVQYKARLAHPYHSEIIVIVFVWHV